MIEVGFGKPTRFIVCRFEIDKKLILRATLLYASGYPLDVQRDMAFLNQNHGKNIRPYSDLILCIGRCGL